MMLALAAIALLAWLYLGLLHGRFWQAGPALPPIPDELRPDAGTWPAVCVVVPARDEAASIEAAMRSLLDQDYPGPFGVVMVDDRSSDGTASVARAIGSPHLQVVDGEETPPGWSGKLWAVAQGVRAARTQLPGEAGYLLLTDADIIHEPEHVASLVAKAQRDGLDQVSEMVALNVESLAERALVPAFVYFFQLLYPFALVNRPDRKIAAAAGGTVLIRASTLSRIGGIESLRGALIDDVALARRVKQGGGRIWLGHSRLARSVRPYPAAADIWRMVARTAYVQLRLSPLLLLGTIAGMMLMFVVPLSCLLFVHGDAGLLGLMAWILSTLSFLPTLGRFGVSPLWALTLPLVALFYMLATVGSAVDHWRGRGVVWKRRAYGPHGGAAS